MQYNKKLNTPIINNRGIGNSYKTETEVQFQPKRMELSLDYTIKLAARMAYKHYSFLSCSPTVKVSDILIYNSIKPSILYNNNISLTLTVSETVDALLVKDWEKLFKAFAAAEGLVDVHLHPSPRKNLNKIVNPHKKGFAFLEQRSIFDASIIASKQLNYILSKFIIDYKPFIPTYNDVLNSVRYWIKNKYRCQDSDIDLTDLMNYIESYNGYEGYYDFIIRHSNNVYNVAKLFYGDIKSWLKYKCRLDTYTKEYVEVEETEKYKYYDLTTKTYKLPVKYTQQVDWLGIYEYGAKRSDRCLSIKSNNGKYCLWLPRKVKIAMATYYREHGGRELKNLLQEATYTSNFKIMEHWNTIKAILSQEKESIEDPYYIIMEYGSNLSSMTEEFNTVDQQETHTEVTVQMDVNSIQQPTETSVESKETTKTGKHISISTIYEEFPKTEDGSTDWSKVERNHDFDGLTGDAFWEAMSKL